MTTNERNRVWPTGTDYSRAVQSPSVSFSDSSLASGRVGTNAMGMPLVASGQNAVVFLVEAEGAQHAIRCFLTPPHEGAIRYAALERHLANTAPRALTSARWLSDGITVGDATWPVVVMPWVQGLPLNIAVEDMIGQPERLRSMAERWGEVVRSLQRAGVAHGDLQHGNVLVRENDSLALVDLDGVWVPEIEIGPPAEYGHPNYQHPQRNVEHWGRYVDSFPGALIKLALEALAADPSLERFLNGENLLFTRGDLVDPGNAPVWEAVCSVDDPAVAAAAVALRRRCSSHIREVLVPFDELHEEDLDATIARPVAAPPAAAAMAPVVAEVEAPAVTETPWWEQSSGATPMTDARVQVAATSVEVPSAVPSKSVSFLGRNTVVAAVVAGALAGVLGSQATALVDPILDERGETVAFVAFIGILLGGFLRSMQSFLARNWSSAFRQFAVGALVGGGAGVLAIVPADAIVRATSGLEPTGNPGEFTIETPFIASVLMFAVVAGFIGFALGMLRSVKTGLWGLVAGMWGGAVGGVIFAATVADFTDKQLDVRFLKPATMLVVALVCAVIGVAYGLMIRARRSASLTIIEGRNSGLEISVEGKRATIGSKSSCDLVLRADLRVEPVHATVEFDGDAPLLALGANAALVNGQPATDRMPLKNGDVVMVGGSYIRLELKGAS